MTTTSTPAKRRSPLFRMNAVAALAMLAPLGLAACGGGLGDQCFDDCRSSCRRGPTLFVDSDCLRECRKQCVLTGRPVVPDRQPAAPLGRTEPASPALGRVPPSGETARPERQASPARTQSWGSVFVAAPPSDRYGSSRGAGSEGEARGVAHDDCFRSAGAGGRCRHLITYGDSCAAIIGAYKGGELTKWFGESDVSQSRAEAKALAVCRKERPEERCRTVDTICAAGRG
jgi:hypothetical protein